MVRHLRKHLVLTSMLFIAAACSRAANEFHGCLGGPNTCSPVAETIPQESNTGSVNPASPTLSCTATAFPTQAAVGEQVRVQVDTFGGAATKSIPGYVSSFASSTSVQGQYNADKAGTIVRRTVQVRDSAGASASCEFSVEILDSTSIDGFACKIEVAPDLIQAGTEAEFTFTAINPPGPVTFSSFEANSGWKIGDSLIQQISSSISKAYVPYQFNGTKLTQVEAVSGDRRVLCKKKVLVGTPNTNPPSTTLTACNVESAPLGFPGDGSQASLAGTVTRLRAIPNGGTAPYTLTFKGADNSGSTVNRIIGSATAGPSALPQVLIRFQRPGAPLIKAEIKDNTGKTVSCQSYHISLPNDAYAVAAGEDTADVLGPQVKVYRGTPESLYEQFPAFEGNFRGGVRVATADFDGDAIIDTLAATGPGGGQRLRVFKGSSGLWSAAKPPPSMLLDTVAGLGADGDGFAIGAGDINRDGRADIVVAGGCSSIVPRMRVLSGADTSKVLANFEVPLFAGQRAGIASIAVADLDADGHSDIIVSSCRTGILAAFSGKSVTDNYTQWDLNMWVPQVLRTLTAHANYQGPFSIAAGDVNHDGNVDIIAGSGDYADPRYWDAAPPAKIFSGANSSLLRSFEALQNHRGLFQFAAADLNGDGCSDIIAAGGTVSLTPTVETHDGYGLKVYGTGYLKRAFNPFAGFLGLLFLGAGG